MSDTVTIIRTLTYEGPREWVLDSLRRRAVKGSLALPNGGVIAEGFVFSSLIAQINAPLESEVKS